MADNGKPASLCSRGRTGRAVSNLLTGLGTLYSIYSRLAVQLRSGQRWREVSIRTYAVPPGVIWQLAAQYGIRSRLHDISVGCDEEHGEYVDCTDIVTQGQHWYADRTMRAFANAMGSFEVTSLPINDVERGNSLESARTGLWKPSGNAPRPRGWEEVLTHVLATWLGYTGEYSLAQIENLRQWEQENSMDSVMQKRRAAAEEREKSKAGCKDCGKKAKAQKKPAKRQTVAQRIKRLI